MNFGLSVSSPNGSDGEECAGGVTKTDAAMENHVRRLDMRKLEVSMPEATLKEVDEADRVLVQNTIYAVMACKHPEQLCVSWNVSCLNTHYQITALLPDDFDVSLVDLEFIQSLNPMRIALVSIVAAGGKAKVVIKVLNHRQRVQLTQGDLIITQKKRKMWG